jgi:hypothetical protein
MARQPIHPGGSLADELREIGISAAQLARTLGVPKHPCISLKNQMPRSFAPLRLTGPPGFFHSF